MWGDVEIAPKKICDRVDVAGTFGRSALRQVGRIREGRQRISERSSTMGLGLVVEVYDRVWWSQNKDRQQGRRTWSFSSKPLFWEWLDGVRGRRFVECFFTCGAVEQHDPDDESCLSLLGVTLLPNFCVEN